MIKAVIIDVSDTAIDKKGRLVDGITELVAFCRQQRLKVVFFSNLEPKAKQLKESGVYYDHLVTAATVFSFKPSFKFVEWVKKHLNIDYSEMIYLGDSDFTDAHLATENRILYFRALWANSEGEYGIPVSHPRRLLKTIKHYLLKQEIWTWYLEAERQVTKPIRKYALLNLEEEYQGMPLLELVDGKMRFKSFFMSHLTSSIYLSRIYEQMDFWGTYPGHNLKGVVSPYMKEFMGSLSKEFKSKHVQLFDYQNPLSVEEYDDFDAIMNSFCLSQKLQRRIDGKTILLIDDFIGQGCTSEWARHLLYELGAKEVIFVSLGKVGGFAKIITINDPFDPFIVQKKGTVSYSETSSEGKWLDNQVTLSVKNT